LEVVVLLVLLKMLVNQVAPVHLELIVLPQVDMAEEPTKI
jgi:hypothetical protein